MGHVKQTASCYYQIYKKCHSEKSAMKNLIISVDLPNFWRETLRNCSAIRRILAYNSKVHLQLKCFLLLETVLIRKLNNEAKRRLAASWCLSNWSLVDNLSASYRLVLCRNPSGCLLTMTSPIVVSWTEPTERALSFILGINSFLFSFFFW